MKWIKINPRFRVGATLVVQPGGLRRELNRTLKPSTRCVLQEYVYELTIHYSSRYIERAEKI